MLLFLSFLVSVLLGHLPPGDLGKQDREGWVHQLGAVGCRGSHHGLGGASVCAGACQEHMVVMMTIQPEADSVPRAPELL